MRPVVVMHVIWAKLRLVWSLAQTPVGRRQVVLGFYWFRAWPLLARLARLHRRTLLRRTRVVAVVGSFGKSTTTRAVQQALGLPMPRRVNSNARTFLAEAVLRNRPWQRQAVFEVGITQQGQMASYAALLGPTMAVVTSIGSEHNRSLGTLEVTRHEKAEMVRALPAGGLAVLNGDDPHVRWMATQTRARVVTFGFEADNAVRGSDYRINWPHGSRFTLQVGDERREVRTRLVGRHQVYPILAAVAVALAEAVSLDQVLPRLEALAPTPHRLEVVPLENGAFVLRDEYKSSLETIEMALETLAEIPARRIVVIGGITEPPGSAGPLYQRLGQRLGQVGSRVVVYGSQRNNRSLVGGARKAGQSIDHFTFVETDVRRAIEVVRAELQPGDVVLLKGRYEERLHRVALALTGRTVRCTLARCDLKEQDCDTCPMLERGWASQPRVGS